eukprot:SAG31_NODE_2884_length_4954_cov_2.669619_5_plen_72_part_00
MLQLIGLMGTKFAAISQHMPGRTAAQVPPLMHVTMHASVFPTAVILFRCFLVLAPLFLRFETGEEEGTVGS